ncbi:hypothetical protein NWFMUON74_39000 [Nocardia wallacei]|uniref:Uncharacterized protein n=1 Tax=Nocardia wallacei TaxID=480035 RepID=A0A7G1KLU9_9NOCA|nr:hypothetical protein NWFMUON74_39000 [Nocardia wallacei]
MSRATVSRTGGAYTRTPWAVATLSSCLGSPQCAAEFCKARDLVIEVCCSGSHYRHHREWRAAMTGMWSQLGQTVRKAMDDSAAMWRFVVCVIVLTAAAVAIIVAAAP